MNALVLQPTPFLASGNEMDGAEMNSVTGADFFESFPVGTPPPDVSHIRFSEPSRRVIGPASVSAHRFPVGHVLPMVPEVKMVDVDASVLTLVTSVKNKPVTRITVDHDPYSSTGPDHFAVQGDNATPAGVKGEDAIFASVSDCFAEDLENLSVLSLGSRHRNHITGSNDRGM